MFHRIVAALALLSLATGASLGAEDRLAIESIAGVEVAITVDDLPDHGALPPQVSRRDVTTGVIAALQNNGVRQAYGLANGSFMERTPEEIDVLKLWLSAGYPLGNHTYDHPHLNAIMARSFTEDIAREDRLLSTLQSFSPLIESRRVFRYPYLDEGDTFAKRDAVRSYLFAHGYRIAEVTTNYDDWNWARAYTRCSAASDNGSLAWLSEHVVDNADRNLRSSKLLARRLFGRDIPQILLIHVGVFTARTLDAVLRDWRAQGARFVTLDQALADPVYRINPNYPDECAACVGEHGRPFLEQIAKARRIDFADIVDWTYSVARVSSVCQAAPAAH